jgi:hypothetical protein
MARPGGFDDRKACWFVRQAAGERRARELQITDDGRLILRWIEPAVQAAQRLLA